MSYTKEQQLALTVMAKIEANPQYWNQRSWHCGTSHCFAGFVELEVKGSDFRNEFESTDTSAVARDALGISPFLAREWFSSCRSLSDLKDFVGGFVDPASGPGVATWRKVASAASPKVTAELLAKLATDESWYARRAVAKSGKVTAELLAKLATDESWCVRCAVAESTKVPAELLAKLATDESWCVRCAVAKSGKVTAELLAKLATDESWYARRAVAKSGKVTAELLAKLATDEDEDVRCAARASTDQLDAQ